MERQDMPGSGQQGAAEQTPRRHKRVGALATSAVVLALVAAFGAILLWRQGGLALLPAQNVPASTLGWRVYHDPLGLFTMRLPPGWTASSSLGSYTQGGPGGSDSGQDETISFSDPALGTRSPSIFVYAMQIHDTAGQLNCVPRPHETTTFNGYPADTSMTDVIFFESGNAHFQIDKTIPGVTAPENPGGPMNPPTPPPAPPAGTVTAYQTLLSDALASFQQTDAQPLACS